jgi:hypothetical protein
MQPDPGNAGADFLRPQSWNGYGYVLGNPLGYTDPSGACDLVVEGLTQTQGSSSTREQEAFASSIGTISVFPFAGSTHPGDLLDGSLSTTNTSAASTKVVASAIINAAQGGGDVNVYGVSAGAAAITSALALLPSSIMSRIHNLVYLIPAATGTLESTSPGGGLVGLLRGSGSNYAFEVDPFSPDDIRDTSCSHNANCAFGHQNWDWLNTFKGSPCSSVVPGFGKINSAIRYGGGGGYNFGSTSADVQFTYGGPEDSITGVWFPPPVWNFPSHRGSVF